MNKERDTTEVEKIACDICRKEVPLSEAMIPEAEEYVAHFCGLECYTQWKKDSEKHGSKEQKHGSK